MKRKRVGKNAVVLSKRIEFHLRRRKGEANAITRLITFRPFAFRYLQTDADRQKVRVVGQLDGGACDAVAATANREPGAESRTIHTAPWGPAGYVEQYREASAINAEAELRLITRVAYVNGSTQWLSDVLINNSYKNKRVLGRAFNSSWSKWKMCLNCPRWMRYIHMHSAAIINH